MSGPTNAAARHLAVIALGGNAILRRGDDGGIQTQFRRAQASLAHVARLAARGTRIVLTHGNGPVVGNILIRNEAARDRVTPMPLFIADADSEGGIGLMLQQVLYNELRRANVARAVATLVTQCVVAEDDPAFERPSKPVGPYYDEAQAHALGRDDGWAFAEVPGCGWRRVVASPRPLRVVEAPTVTLLAEAGDIVIAAGGGGVPVVEAADGTLRSVDAVIDKDWASALLARQIGADALAVLMETDAVYLGWGTPEQRPLRELRAEEALELVASGRLEGGSIAPKVAACATFAQATGHDAVICAVEALPEALAGRAGTRITP